jgi:UDP-N-acetylglucosamine 2-epimerase (non-hydrolysing)/GDP/UDP-N,N'-diacetylbacillosamine 2-epimerase (hydrolysing)
MSLIVSGAHLAPEFGNTVKEIEADGFPIDERVEMLLSSERPVGVAKSIGVGIIGFAQVFERQRPDILVLLGDRFETFSAAAAALPFGIPLAHLHGGESTEGVIDEAIRHSITKMSHLHFVSTTVYRDRVIQLGEEPWRVITSGAPSLDNLRSFTPLSKRELAERIGLDLTVAPLLVTFHPVTLDYENTSSHLRELLDALAEVKVPIVFTYSNADTASRTVLREIEAFAKNSPHTACVANLGNQAYFTLMQHAAAMVGNSSSGIIEAASFALPVVNIGARQRGRLAGANVIHVACMRADIVGAIRTAIDPRFRARLHGMVNPYGDGMAAERIVRTLQDTPIDLRLLEKKFQAMDVK